MKLKEKKYLSRLIDKYEKKDSSNYLLSPNSFSNEDIINEIKIILTKKITMSEMTKKFEYEFSKYMGAKYALMVNSGSSANLLSTFALINPIGISPIVLSVTEELNPTEYNRTIKKGIIFATFLLLLFACVGELIFKFYGKHVEM